MRASSCKSNSSLNSLQPSSGNFRCRNQNEKATQYILSKKRLRENWNLLHQNSNVPLVSFSGISTLLHGCSSRNQHASCTIRCVVHSAQGLRSQILQRKTKKLMLHVQLSMTFAPSGLNNRVQRWDYLFCWGLYYKLTIKTYNGSSGIMQICVDVETTFPGGLVVSCTDEYGVEYRGALLKRTSGWVRTRNVGPIHFIVRRSHSYCTRPFLKPRDYFFCLLYHVPGHLNSMVPTANWQMSHLIFMTTPTATLKSEGKRQGSKCLTKFCKVGMWSSYLQPQIMPFLQGSIQSKILIFSRNVSLWKPTLRSRLQLTGRTTMVAAEVLKSQQWLEYVTYSNFMMTFLLTERNQKALKS